MQNARDPPSGCRPGWRVGLRCADAGKVFISDANAAPLERRNEVDIELAGNVVALVPLVDAGDRHVCAKLLGHFPSGRPHVDDFPEALHEPHTMDNRSIAQDGKRVDCEWTGFRHPWGMGGPAKKRLTGNIDRKLVGQRIEAAREALGIKERAEMADAIGVDRSAYTKIADGKRLMPPDALDRACDLYGLTMEFVYRGRLESIQDANLRARIFAILNSRRAA